MPTTAKGHILVIAPDFDLRRSLAFALEAEGYAVTARAEIDIAAMPADRQYDCTVIDHAAVLQSAYVIAFCERARPVILLSNSPMAWLSEYVAVTVELPVPGGALSAAIQSAVLSRSGVVVP